MFEEHLELGIEEGGVVSLENFGDKSASDFESFCSYLKGGYQQLTLDVLIDIVESSD